MVKSDRRVQRTHKQLQQSLTELINESGYDAITVQQIIDRANVGRTTFYDHYSSKDDLFMSCHEAVVRGFHQVHLDPKSLLMPTVPSAMIEAYRNLLQTKPLLYPIFQSKYGQLIFQRIQDQSAEELEANLRTTFNESDSAVPFDLLANYLAGAQITLVQWWLQKHQPHTPETLAKLFHRLQRAVIRDALGLNGET